MTQDAQHLSLSELMDVAVAAEEHGAAFYKALAGRFVGDPAVAEVFMTLYRDETEHRDRFAALRRRVKETGSAQRGGVLKARAVEVFFRDGVDKKVKDIEGREDALELALQFEKNTLAFYESMRDVLGEEPVLASLIKEEKRHVEVIMRTMMTEAKFRGLDDDFTGKHPEGAAKQDARRKRSDTKDEFAKHEPGKS